MDSAFIKLYFFHLSELMRESRDYLIELDSVVGDGDLGLTMSDGFAAAYGAVANSADADIGKLLYAAGKAMANKVPSTMGTLVASGFMSSGKAMRGMTEFDLSGLRTIFSAFEAGVIERGNAKVGEKTFLDGLHPAVAALGEATDARSGACSACAAAKQGFENTRQMRAIHGRAALRGEASRTLADPGAAVAALMLEALVKAMG